jgi:hypothetical protein
VSCPAGGPGPGHAQDAFNPFISSAEGTPLSGSPRASRRLPGALGGTFTGALAAAALGTPSDGSASLRDRRTNSLLTGRAEGQAPPAHQSLDSLAPALPRTCMLPHSLKRHVSETGFGATGPCDGELSSLQALLDGTFDHAGAASVVQPRSQSMGANTRCNQGPASLSPVRSPRRSMGKPPNRVSAGTKGRARPPAPLPPTAPHNTAQSAATPRQSARRTAGGTAFKPETRSGSGTSLATSEVTPESQPVVGATCRDSAPAVLGCSEQRSGGVEQPPRRQDAASLDDFCRGQPGWAAQLVMEYDPFHFAAPAPGPAPDPSFAPSPALPSGTSLPVAGSMTRERRISGASGDAYCLHQRPEFVLSSRRLDSNGTPAVEFMASCASSACSAWLAIASGRHIA